MKCKIKQFLLIFIGCILFSAASVFAAQTTSNSIDNQFAAVTKGKIKINMSMIVFRQRKCVNI